MNRDTEQGWDHLFVEVRTAGGDDWTTLPDANGHTNQDVGACPGFLDCEPVPLPLPDRRRVDPGDPTTRTTTSSPATRSARAGRGTPSAARARAGRLAHPAPDDAGAPRQVEVSITYASDQSVQGRGVVLDDIVVSTGQGTTSFEADGDPLDGWVAPIDAGPAGERRQPEHLDRRSTSCRPYPVSAHRPSSRSTASRRSSPSRPATSARIRSRQSGGIVDERPVGFALENQTRPDLFAVLLRRAGGQRLRRRPRARPPVVRRQPRRRHVAAHLAQRGLRDLRRVAVERARGLRHHPADLRLRFAEIPAEDRILGAGDRRPRAGATVRLPGLRARRDDPPGTPEEVGDDDFFRILKAWVQRQAGGNVTTARVHRPRREHLAQGPRCALRRLAVGRQAGHRFASRPDRLSRPRSSGGGAEPRRTIHGKKGQPFKDATGRSH